MSNASAPRSPRLVATKVVNGVRRPLRVLSFWTAVVLPFLYLPVLVAGPADPAVLQATLALIALHGVAVVLGHRHRPRGAD